MDLKELYSLLGKSSSKEVTGKPSFEEMGITEEKIKAIDNWAKERTRFGIVATYIPELKKVDPELTAIAIGDLYANEIVVGSGKDVTVSMQSAIKPFLYIYALNKDLSPEEISGIEPTALPFSADRILRPELKLRTAEHPLDNAGAISSAGAIGNFEEFLKFMRSLTGNPKLNVLEDIFQSEIKTNHNNRAATSRLVAGGRFQTAEEGADALDNYTRACSIGVTVTDALHACVILAAGGKNVYADDKKLFEENHAVRAIAAMNSYGMYEESGKISLLVSGARANTSKSGVGGLIINVDPGRGAFVTYNPLLNSAGNSVYGMNAIIPLNALLSAPGAMRLDLSETIRSIEAYEKTEREKIHEEIFNLVNKGEDPHIYKTDQEILKKLEKEYSTRSVEIKKLLKK